MALIRAIGQPCPMTTGSACASLLYVSQVLLPHADRVGEIARIVEVSRSRNAALQVTGALIATYRFFAQILEGPPDAIEALMNSIRCDKRHRAVTVVREETLAGRRFPDWSMAYSGAAGYVDRTIGPLIGPSCDPRPVPDTDRLVRLIREFTR